MKLTMLGWYGRRNIGDEAFKLAHSVLFPQAEIEHRLAGTPSRSTCLVLGGGDVVNQFYLDLIPPDMPFYALGVGLGYPAEAELLAQRPVIKAVVRNRADAELLASRGVAAVHAPDLVFTIDPSAIQPTSVPSTGSKRKRLCVLLSDHISPSCGHADVSRLHYWEYFKWELGNALSYLSEFYEVYWLPLSDDRDAMDCKTHMDVFHRVARREGHHLLPYPGTPEAALGIMAGMDLVVTMKYHGVIFSTLLGRPFVNIGVSRKTQQFCEESGLQDFCVPDFAFTQHRFLQLAKNAEAPGVSALLQDVAEGNRRKLLRLRDQELSKWRAPRKAAAALESS